MALNDDREGRRYRVVFNDGTRKNKQVVLVFLEEIDTEYVFDARPLAGTQRLRKNDVITMIETEMPLSPWPTVVGTGSRR